MQEKSLKNSQTLRLQEIKSNLNCFHPVVRNGWVIKFSIYKDSGILLIFTSKYTGQTIIRYCNSEDDAVDYINIVIEKDATVHQDHRES
jgi:hypothetical protein